MSLAKIIGGIILILLAAVTILIVAYTPVGVAGNTATATHLAEVTQPNYATQIGNNSYYISCNLKFTYGDPALCANQISIFEKQHAIISIAAFDDGQRYGQTVGYFVITSE